MPHFNIADLALALIWLYCSFRGYLRGLVKEVGSLAAIATGFYCAGVYHKALAPRVAQYISGNYAGTAAYLIIFTAALFGVWFLTLAASGIVKITMTEATSPTLAEVVLGRPQTPEPAPSCRFDQVRDPFTAVIFGATGDLTARMLVPALAALCAGHHLPKTFAIVGAGRMALSEEAFREQLAGAVTSLGGVAPEAWDALAPHLSYRQVDYADPASFAALAGFLEALAARHGLGGNRLFYLAVPPTAYESIAVGLAGAGLAAESTGYARLVVEKPFGRDLETARVLEAALHTRFKEGQIFRIDHYLAKETVQNILMLRFANAIFEPLWNRRYIDHVSILAAECLGVEHRAAYYDHFGVLRDMISSTPTPNLPAMRERLSPRCTT